MTESIASLRQRIEGQAKRAVVGDVLDDGSIVFIKEEIYAIVVCSKEKEFVSTWNDLEANKIKNGFGPEWFIPDKTLLMRASKLIPAHFSNGWYWSSTEQTDKSAWYVKFPYGDIHLPYKTQNHRVRPFKLIANW